MADSAEMSRKELLEARSRVESQISELSYAPVMGSSRGPYKADLLKRLKTVLMEINQELAERDANNAF